MAVMRPLILLLFVGLSLSACSSSAPNNDADNGSESSSSSVIDDTAPADSGDLVELVDTGFGQDGEYVQGIAIVTTQDESSIGEFVTVSMNFLDADGKILKTEEQVESFSWVGQELVLPVWADLSDDPAVEVASVDVSVSLSDHGSSESARPPLEAVEAVSVEEGEYGNIQAIFEMTNETDADLENARMGVVCYDAGGQIVGGTSEYPNLIASGKAVRLEVDVTTTGTPDTCTAFPSYGG